MPAPSDNTGGPTAGSGTTASGAYKDGSYTSPSTSLIYGNLQISVTIAGGKIADVKFLQYPNTPQHSLDMSNMSTPILKSEAIAAQNANVDIVSGATQTSQAFQQALQSILTQA